MEPLGMSPGEGDQLQSQVFEHPGLTDPQGCCLHSTGNLLPIPASGAAVSQWEELHCTLQAPLSHSQCAFLHMPGFIIRHLSELLLEVRMGRNAPGEAIQGVGLTSKNPLSLQRWKEQTNKQTNKGLFPPSSSKIPYYRRFRG